MLHRHEYKSLTWVDLESPTVDEIRRVVDDFGIDAHVADELLAPSLRPHIETHTEYLYLVLHFPTLRHHTHGFPEQEVDFIIGRDFIVTIRYEAFASFVEFRKVFEVNATLEADHFSDNAFDIFLLLTKRLYRAIDSEIDEVRRTLDHIESQIYAGKEKEMVIALSKAGRDILTLKQSLDPHQDVLSQLVEDTGNFAGKEYTQRVKAIENTYYRSRKHVTRIWQTLAELRETNNSLLSTKQNEVMKIFTILAFVTFPLSLLASVFGMNTMNTPFVGGDHDFWVIIAMMGATTLLMFIYFRYKRWL